VIRASGDRAGGGGMCGSVFVKSARAMFEWIDADGRRNRLYSNEVN
jgi:hypothetical protein